MKHVFCLLGSCALSLSMTGCMDMDSGYGDDPITRPRPVYGPDNSPTSYYNGGGFGQTPRAVNDNPYSAVAQAYHSGAERGRGDRVDKLAPSYHRHEAKYDASTEREFARGYSDGYNGH